MTEPIEQAPVMTEKIHANVILQAPTDEADGLALVLLESGHVRWARVKTEEGETL